MNKGPGRSRSVYLTARIATLMSIVIVILFVAVGRLGPVARADGGVEFVLQSVLRVDPANETVTLPVFQGTFAGSPVYYIVTESSDKDDAARRKVNPAPKLRHALGTPAVQRVIDVNGVLDFSGTVRFASSRRFRPGPDGIPPGAAPFPSSEGDANYSPLITTGNGIVLNASQVANASGVHDALVSLRLGVAVPEFPGAVGEVTLATFGGHWNSAPLLYLHMDASAIDVSTVEGSNFAPNLNFAPGLGSNDPSFSARSAIIPIENGREPRGDPERQGLRSFMLNQGDPLNVTQTFPGKQDDRYSPVWDVHILRWTEAAIAAGLRRRMRSASDVIGEFNKGNLMDTGTGPPNPSLDGIRANNAISMCPIVVRLPSVDPDQRGQPQVNRW